MQTADIWLVMIPSLDGKFLDPLRAYDDFDAAMNVALVYRGIVTKLGVDYDTRSERVA